VLLGGRHRQRRAGSADRSGELLGEVRCGRVHDVVRTDGLENRVLLGTTNYVHQLNAVGKAAQLVEHLTRIGRSGGVVLTALGMLDTMRLEGHTALVPLPQKVCLRR